MDDVQTAEVQATESVNEVSQTSQETGQDAGNTEQQQAAQTQQEQADVISRLEYNKARESERKARAELARLSKVLESARGGINLHETLSKTDPARLKKIIEIAQAKEELQKAEDDSWLDEYDPRIAKTIREQKQFKSKVERELLSRIDQLEHKLNSAETRTVSQNVNVLESTYASLLKQNNIFSDINEEVEQSPKYKMIRSYVLETLSEKYDDPRMATVDDLQEVFNDLKAGLSEIGKQELTTKVRPTVPASGSRSGQIPKSDKVTSEDVTNLWKGFRKETGW